MKIQGANLGEKEVEYKLLSEYPFFSDERQEIVRKLEQLYLKYQEESKETDIKSFPLKDGTFFTREQRISLKRYDTILRLVCNTRGNPISVSKWNMY